MREKARSSLIAGVKLLEAGLVDSATSRLYYALFQAAVYAFETKLGKGPGDLTLGMTRWGHAIVARNAFLIRRRKSDEALLLKTRSLRFNADYSSTPVARADVQPLVDDVGNFVREATS